MILLIPPNPTPEDLLAVAAPLTAGGDPKALQKGAELLEEASQEFERRSATSKVILCRTLAARAYLLLGNFNRVKFLLKNLGQIASTAQKEEIQELLRQCVPLTVWERLMKDDPLLLS